MTPEREPPLVSVIVPHYRDFAGLALCLASLEAQIYPRDRFEVVVADNASPEGPAAVEAVIRGRAKLVVVAERGAGPARNGGVDASAGPILAFIDSDCVADPSWLEEGVRALARFDLIGGHVKVLVRDMDNMSGPEAFERVFAFDFKTYIEKKGFTGAGNLFCRRELFDKVGGFRTGLSEDLEWSRRAVAGGARLGYARSAVVGHPARVTWEELRDKWKRLNAETFGLSIGARGHRTRWLLRSLLLPASAIAHMPRVLRSRELTSWSQRWSAIKTLYRLRFWRLADALSLLK